MSIAITCSSCGAASQIPTSLFVERFRGRKTSVRCKRCLEAIIVDDTSSEGKLEAAVASGSTGSLRAVEVRLPVPQVASPSVPEKPELRAVPRRGKLVSALLGLGLLGGAVYVQVSHARQPALPMRAAVAPPPVIARSVELSPAAVASPAPTPSDVVAPEATPVVHDERALGFAMRWGTKQAELCHQRGGSAGRTVRVDLTFEPNGKVSRAALNGEEAPNSAEDRCILGQFRGVMIPRFAGEAVAITREIKLR